MNCVTLYWESVMPEVDGHPERTMITDVPGASGITPLTGTLNGPAVTPPMTVKYWSSTPN